MKTIISVFAVIVVFLTAVSCGSKSDTNGELAKLKKQQAQIEAKIKSLEEAGMQSGVETMDSVRFRYVGISDIRFSPFDHYIRVQGKLDGDNNASVFADVPGTIIARYADVGQGVKKGQVLAQIDDQQYRKQLESLETQYKFAEQMFDKQKRLWDQKIGSEVQFLQARTSKESLEQQISGLKEQIEKFRIKSPLDRTIEECNIMVGSVVSPDPRSAAFRVVAFRNLKVSAEVSEAYAARVQTGDKVLIYFPDLNKHIEAKANFVSKYIDPVNRTFIIECRVPDRLPEMKANMVAIIQINDYHSENSIQVPMNVIQADGNGSYVYVVRKKDNFHGAYKQPVTIGNTYNGVAEIISGLEVNDKLIMAGFQELIEGEYVRFENRPGFARGSSN